MSLTRCMFKCIQRKYEFYSACKSIRTKTMYLHTGRNQNFTSYKHQKESYPSPSLVDRHRLRNYTYSKLSWVWEAGGSSKRSTIWMHLLPDKHEIERVMGKIINTRGRSNWVHAQIRIKKISKQKIHQCTKNPFPPECRTQVILESNWHYSLDSFWLWT